MELFHDDASIRNETQKELSMLLSQVFSKDLSGEELSKAFRDGNPIELLTAVEVLTKCKRIFNPIRSALNAGGWQHQKRLRPER